MSEENKAIARRLIDEVITEGNLDVVDEIMAADYVHHDPANPDAPGGPEGYKELVRKYRAAFSDLQLTVDELVAEGDAVTTRWSWSGTHDGELEGIAPTGVHTSGTGISINHFSDGKTTEAWIVWDALGLMRQLGVVS